MAFTSKAYVKPIENQYDGDAVVDFNTDTIKVALTTSTEVPDQDTDDFWNDASGNEVASGSGYTTGGQQLDSCTVTAHATNNTITLDAADEAFSTFSATYRNYHVYKDTGVGSTSPLIVYGSETGDQTGGGGTYTFVWNANGIMQFTAA